MSEDSKGNIKQEPLDVTALKRESCILPDNSDEINIQNIQDAVIITDHASAMMLHAENEFIDTLNEPNNVVVVASVSSNGELITSEGMEFMEEERLDDEHQEELLDNETDNNVSTDKDDSYEEPLDPNTCKFCRKEFKSQTGLKRHLMVCQPDTEDEDQDDPLAFEICHCCGEPVDTAHKVGDYPCSKCDKLFVAESARERHNRIVHCDGLTCPDCDKKCKTRQELEKHIILHMEKPFACFRCNKVFTRKYHLDRHVAQTGCDGKPREIFKCQVCDRGFSRRDNLREHLRAHAGQIKRKKFFECSVCKKEFHGAALLQIHMRTHTGERPFQCTMCPKRFPSSGAMKKHTRMHTGERPYECNECHARFAAKETLNRHVRTHTGHKPHSCQFCGKSFIQASQLRAHIFHHTGENGFTCEHCGKAFNRRARLVTHVKFVHEGAKPFECETCTKTFVRKEDLARHSILHSGIKPHECPVCQKTFAMKSSLKTHLNTHRKEQPRSCDECGRAFIRQDCLIRHMRNKHRDMLEDILAGAEKKRLQQQLLHAASQAVSDSKPSISETQVWNELTLTDSIKELLTLLVDEATLRAFGWPDTPVDKLLDSVIRRCGHKPASEEDFDYIGRLRENAKLLFTVVIDDSAVKSLLNNQTVDEVILHVLRLAKAE